MTDGTDPAVTDNRLLSLIGEEERERLAPDLRRVTLERGRVIFHEDEPMREVVFPHDGVISVVSMSREGQSVEVGMVGFEGAAGLSVVLGDARTVNRRAVVQVAGGGFALGADAMRREFDRCGRFQQVLLTYAQAYLTVVTQSVVCQAFHGLDERLARWLVECRFRTKTDELRLTHEYIAEMLGVRRAGVSEAVGRLEQDGLIRHARGVVTVLDRERLEAAACDCCRVIRSEFERLYGS
jgi:CRP-like cAMP-binding protein